MNDSYPEPDLTLAGQTVSRVREALSHQETACVTKVLEIIQEMSGKAEHMCVQDLADIIGGDLTTVAKIMKTANCLGYNPSGAEVSTVNEAIQLIGFETIRNLVISLLLLENAEKRSGQVRSVAADALTSALLAHAIAPSAGANADQAFVCATLRHYGRLLLATFLPDEYQDTLDLAAGMPFDTAATLTFGLPPLQLGEQVLAEANLSRVILHTLHNSSPVVLRAKDPSDMDRLLLVSELSSKLCEIMNSPEMGSAEFEAAATQLLKRYAGCVTLTPGDLKEALSTVSRTLNTVGRAQGFTSTSSELLGRIQLLGENRPFAAAKPKSRAPAPNAATAAALGNTDALVSGIAQVQGLVAAKPPNARQAFTVAARAIKMALRLQSCLVFLKEPRGPLYSAAVGSGAFFNAIRNQPLIDPSQKDVFTVCLARGEDILIQNPEDPNIAPFIPDWFKAIASTGPMALFPVRDAEGTFAILCGMVGRTEHIELNGARLQQIKALRSHLAGIRDAAEEQREAA